LAEEYANDKFDMVIDAVGIQDLYANSPSYLKAGKPYVSIGIQSKSKKISWGALFGVVGQMLSNMMWPRFFGGTDRPYIQVTAMANLTDMERAATMIRDGKLKVLVDHVWEMKNVLKVF
jgi:NADPH:quinone reductase-like Zn-dependent oxidoreductase